MTVKETLIAAKALIDTEDKWSPGFGKGKNPMHGEGGHLCALYALGEARPNNLATLDLAVRALTNGGDSQALVRFNDTHTHAEVMAMFDKAIEAAS